MRAAAAMMVAALLPLAMLPATARAEPRGVAQAIGAPTHGIDARLLLPRPAQIDTPMPTVLNVDDEIHYAAIFRLQRQGDWAAADRQIAKLHDRRLIGTVQAQRYLHPRYRTSWPELQRWLDVHGDHPAAPKLYRLAQSRMPKGAKPPKRPEEAVLGGIPGASVRNEGIGQGAGGTGSRIGRSDADDRLVEALFGEVRSLARRGEPGLAEQRLARGDRAVQLLSAGERDELRADVAAAHLLQGADREALALVGGEQRDDGEVLPNARWTAGLAAWRLDKFEAARIHFEALAQSRTASAWLTAAGAYWAARANWVLRRPADADAWLARATRHGRTFYGLLARRALGRPLVEFDWRMPALSRREVDAFKRQPAGGRALALLQLGETVLAEQEIRRFAARVHVKQLPILLKLAQRANMPALSMQLGLKLAAGDPGYTAALYPVPQWRPDDGYTIDPALLYAIMRQESGFDPQARSGQGALGLMQLMPRTAGAMAGDNRGSGEDWLFDPLTNVELGQRYILHLMEQDAVQGNLVLLATAYNAGPGNLRKWERRVDHRDDPLLFIATLPSRETRVFVERILAAYWIYSHRLGRASPPSLDQLAAGHWPIYPGYGSTSQALALNAEN